MSALAGALGQARPPAPAPARLAATEAPEPGAGELGSAPPDVAPPDGRSAVTPRSAPSEAAEPGAGPLVRALPFDAGSNRRSALVGRLRFEAGFVLRSGDRRFGGLSGIWIDPDGTRLILVSDRGAFWTARPEHGPDDRLIGLTDWRVVKPERLRGDPGGRFGGDAEALAGAPPDGLVVAYESAQRLRRFAIDDLHAAPGPLARPDELREPSNLGVETLATLADGTLFAIAEGIFDDNGDNAAWLVQGDRIERLGYRPASGFAPTGADRLDDEIYILERYFSWFGGFRARVVVLPVAEVRPGARLGGRELARLEAIAGENFEGLAARRGRDGRVLLYVVSDDNFLALQRTLLLQFSLDAGPSTSSRLGEDVRAGHQGTEG